MGKPYITKRVNAWYRHDAIDKSGYTVGMKIPDCDVLNASPEVDSSFRCDVISAHGIYGSYGMWEVVATFDKPDYFTLPELAYITWVPQK